MTYADKIAEAPERIWAWEIDFDGWWDTEKPDWIETPVAYTRADLADAQAQEIAELRRMLKSTVCYGCNRRIGDKQWLGFICVSCKSKREFLSRAALGDTP